MGKVGTCLVTLAGLLLAAGAQTFTGKESAGQPGVGQPSRGPGGGGRGERGYFGGGGGLVWVFVYFCIFLLFFFLSFFF